MVVVVATLDTFSIVVLFIPQMHGQRQIQPQVMAAASGRVPLPVDLPDDGPIYVNAKQYHGILRRRQMRAKLEAQNKLVKTRKVSSISATAWISLETDFIKLAT